MRRLLCLLALTLMLHPAFAQSFVATAATSQVQQRVSEILQAGGRPTPESLLQKSSTVRVSAAAFGNPAHDAATKQVHIAGKTSVPFDDDVSQTSGELQAAGDENGVRAPAARDVHIDWNVRQFREVTHEPQAERLESGTPNLNESAELFRRQRSMQERPASERTDVDFVKVFPGTRDHDQDSTEHPDRPQDSKMGSSTKDTPNSSRVVDEDSLQGLDAKDAELLQRLSNVDWEAVLAAAARDAEAEERAAAAKQAALTEARNTEVRRRMQLAAAANKQAELERQHLTAQRKEALHAINKATGEIQFAQELKRKAAEVRQQLDAAREYHTPRDANQQASFSGSSSSSGQQYAHSSHDRDSYKRQERDGYEVDASYPDPEGYDEEEDYPNRVKVIVYEKNRSQPRYFPGGGMYSFTSELTCTTEEEVKAKMAYKAFPLLTPRMTKTTVGLCEWTVAEGNPTKVNRNVFLLGNGWATCTFLPIASKVCSKPISGGLTLTIQALMYQFAQPQSIREPDADEQAAVKTADAKQNPAGPANVSGPAAVNMPRRRLSAVSGFETATKPDALVAEVASAAKHANGTAAARTQGEAAAVQRSRKRDYHVDVELQNVFLGLITGAHGPTKSHKYKSGALQYVFGPPLETDGETHAVQTQMLPTAAVDPASLRDLQEGLPQLVPGTYQFAFDEE